VYSGWILQIFLLRFAQFCHIRATYPTHLVPSYSRNPNILWSIHLVKSSVVQISHPFCHFLESRPSVFHDARTEKSTMCGGSVDRWLTSCHFLLHFVWCMRCGLPHCRYHFILQCAVGLLTVCYRVTILYCSVQWVCWLYVTVLPFYTAVCSGSADGMFVLPFYTAVCSGSTTACYHFILQCAVGLLTACYRVTILYCSVQWVCWRHATVLQFYTAVCSGSADGMLPCYNFILQCAVGLLTACYRVTILYCSVQWVCWRHVTVLQFYTAVWSGSADGMLPLYVTECAVGLLTTCYHFMLQCEVGLLTACCRFIFKVCLLSVRCQVTHYKQKLTSYLIYLANV